MKLVCKLATFALVLCAVSESGIAQPADGRSADAQLTEAQRANVQPQLAAQNLVRGVIGPTAANTSWSNFSAINLIPGSGLFPNSSASTVFYLGFAAGTQADIGNMVVYTTPRGSLTISAVTPVKFGGVSNPSIDLASTSVCPAAPSTATPCIVRLDPTPLAMTPGSDYYLVVYFTNNSNNSGVGATAASKNQTSLAGTYTGGDDTQLSVGGTIPATATGGPYFLMYVMTN